MGVQNVEYFFGVSNPYFEIFIIILKILQGVTFLFKKLLDTCLQFLQKSTKLI